jgi:diguanylate cyclase (GGDEF)-like protein
LHLVERQDGRGKKLTEISLNDRRIRRIKLPDEIRGPLKTISEGHSLLIADMQTEPTLLSLLENEQARHDIRSAILAPLVLDQEVLGALSLSATLPSIFSEADLRLLSSFAATATAAIHNAILYSETQSLATTDPLTGELNRRALFEMGQREIERFQRFGRPLSWVMFDIDRFKQINDTYGHAAGDQVLVTIVERCCRVIRHIDIVGRYGGDEFVILLPETDYQIAGEIADRVRTSISDTPVETDAGAISVSVSMGVTVASQDTADLGLLLNKADQALYRSKRAGRNTITVLI